MNGQVLVGQGTSVDAQVHRPVLEINDLVTMFDTEAGSFRAVNGISFFARRGETVAIVGESGSGKSVTALSVMRLLPPNGRTVAGEVRLHGRDLLSIPESQMRRIRGNDISMIFQDPMSSLNPVFTVGNQLIEAARAHEKVSRREAAARAIKALDDVQIPDARRRLEQYPHELSGGMRQRVMIAMALISGPSVLIADEPTTALDVTVQAQILDLLREVQREHGLALILVTHDLGVVADMADRILVCYAGRLIEQAPVADLFRQPRHPYTEGLMRSIPDPERDVDVLATIEGVVPSPHELGDGCAFANRCDYSDSACRHAVPPLTGVGSGRSVACFRSNELSLVGTTRSVGD